MIFSRLFAILVTGLVLVEGSAKAGAPVSDAATAAQLGQQFCSFPGTPKVDWSAKRTPTNDWVAWPGDANGPYCSKPMALVSERDGHLACDIAKCAQQPPATDTTSARVLRSQNCLDSYPSAAKKLGEEGKATVQVTISSDGAASNAEIKTSSGYDDLDQATLICVKQWAFKPAVQNGTPVESSKSFLVSWMLSPPGPPVACPSGWHVTSSRGSDTSCRLGNESGFYGETVGTTTLPNYASLDDYITKSEVNLSRIPGFHLMSEKRSTVCGGKPSWEIEYSRTDMLGPDHPITIEQVEIARDAHVVGGLYMRPSDQPRRPEADFWIHNFCNNAN